MHQSNHVLWFPSRTRLVSPLQDEIHNMVPSLDDNRSRLDQEIINRLWWKRLPEEDYWSWERESLLGRESLVGRILARPIRKLYCQCPYHRSRKCQKSEHKNKSLAWGTQRSPNSGRDWWQTGEGEGERGKQCDVFTFSTSSTPPSVVLASRRSTCRVFTYISLMLCAAEDQIDMSHTHRRTHRHTQTNTQPHGWGGRRLCMQQSMSAQLCLHNNPTTSPSATG